MHAHTNTAVVPSSTPVPLVSPNPVYDRRWLLAKDEYSLEARLALGKLRGITHDDDIQVSFLNIRSPHYPVAPPPLAPMAAAAETFPFMKAVSTRALRYEPCLRDELNFY